MTQVFRALRPAANNKACNALLAGLAKCLVSPTRLSLEMAADIVLTLQAGCDMKATQNLAFQCAGHDQTCTRH